MKLERRGEALLLHVKVVPNSSRTGFAGMLGEAVKIKVAAPPEGGRANRAVEKLVAEALGVAPRNVSVVAGHSAPLKTIQIVGVAEEAALERLRAVTA